MHSPSVKYKEEMERFRKASQLIEECGIVDDPIRLEKFRTESAK